MRVISKIHFYLIACPTTVWGWTQYFFMEYKFVLPRTLGYRSIEHWTVTSCTPNTSVFESCIKEWLKTKFLVLKSGDKKLKNGCHLVARRFTSLAWRETSSSNFVFQHSRYCNNIWYPVMFLPILFLKPYFISFWIYLVI